MNSEQTHRRTPMPALLLLAAAFVAREAAGQDVLAPHPGFSVTPPALQQLQENNIEVFQTPDLVQVTELSPFHAGPVTFRPHVFYRIFDGDGLPAQGTNHVSSTINEISPGMTFMLGTHWSLDYTPTLTYYSSRDFTDTLDHYVRLVGGAAYGDWIFGLMQSFRASSDSLAQTGTQTTQDRFLTELNASWTMNSKMTLDLGVSQDILSTEDFNSYNEWMTMNWLNYRFYEQLIAGFGLGVGYTDVKESSDMTFEQIQGRIRWRATQKLSVEIHGGIEVREFISGGQDTLINPVMGATIQYQPLDVTRFSLTLDRTVDQSYFVDQVNETMSIMAGFNQRLLGRLYLDLSGGFSRTEYVSSGGVTDRTDDYYVFNARLGTSFLKNRGTVALFYQYTDNISDEPGFTFQGNQVGLELGFGY